MYFTYIPWSTSFTLKGLLLYRDKAFDFHQMTWPPLDLPSPKLTFLPMLCFPSQGLPRFTPATNFLGSLSQ